MPAFAVVMCGSCAEPSLRSAGPRAVRGRDGKAGLPAVALHQHSFPVNLTEPDYLPQQPGTLPPGPWLVLAPHPDDETFGMGGAIAAARGAGERVDVLVLTDGALGGFGEEDLAALRERETRAALDVLGVADLAFWREPDRGLNPSPMLVERLATKVIEGAYAAVFFPAPTEPHPDHRATAVLGWEALRRCGFVARPVSYEISVQGPVNCLMDISATVDRKIEAMAAYGSQVAQKPYAERVLALNRTRTWSLPGEVGHAEGFFVFDAADQPFDAVLAGIFGHWLNGVCDQAGESSGLSATPADGACAASREAAALRAELAALRGSRSWRITAPLRAFAMAVRRIVHGR